MPWGYSLPEDPLLTSYYHQCLKSRIGDSSNHPAPLLLHVFTMELLQDAVLDDWRKKYFGKLFDLLGDEQFNLMMNCLGKYEYLVESSIFPDIKCLTQTQDNNLPLSMVYERFVSLSKTCLPRVLLYLNDWAINKNKPGYADCLQKKRSQAQQMVSYLATQRDYIKALSGWIGSFYKALQGHISQVYDKSTRSRCRVFFFGYKKGTMAYKLGKLRKDHLMRYKEALPEIIKAHKDLSKGIKTLVVCAKEIRPDNDVVTVRAWDMMEMAVLPPSGYQEDHSSDDESDSAALLP